MFFCSFSFFFFFNDTATTEIYTLSLHDALPIAGLHWSSIVRVQHQRLMQALLTQHATLQQVRCMLATFSLVNLIANDFAAVQVFEHVQVIKLSTHPGRQIGNIPAPDLARANGGVGCRLFAALWCPALATMVQLSSLF